jgi:acetylornithine/succinyldiaminopimelate/putrescine aminotransferase
VQGLSAQQLVERLQTRGVLVLAVGPDTVRAVTNLMVSAEDISEAVGVFSAVLKKAV